MIAGRYELEREIGRGGMGAVWLARDELLGRPVAVKRTGLVPGADPDMERAEREAMQRAEREARLAARLNHPHVVAVFDLVADDHGQWLVMEYVEGRTLSKLVDEEGALPADRVATLIGQAAEALAAAHEAGIVHRDVKPSNILVAATDGHVKLSDFGIARADSEKTLTATGLVTGSPAYLAPEVASGRSASPASDVWSLGATAFHALAGKPPYEVGDNLMGTLYRIVHEDPPRLEDAGWLAPVLEATMTKEPDRRWTMRQVSDFLAAGPEGVATAPVAAPAPDPSATQVMTPPPVDTPVQGEPVRRHDTPPEPIAAAQPPGDGSRRRSRALPVGLALLALLVAGLVAWALVGGDGESPSAAGNGDEPSRSATSQSAPPEEEEPAEPTAQGMERFIADYLATAPESPETSFEMLTPAFQSASGGIEGYTGFWDTIDSADLVDVSADPGSLTVSYTVAYVTEAGGSSTDDVTLRLAFRDGSYLIAEES